MSDYAEYYKQRADANKRLAANRLKAKQEQEERDHQAWLRLCGSVAPIGGLGE